MDKGNENKLYFADLTFKSMFFNKVIYTPL